MCTIEEHDAVMCRWTSHAVASFPSHVEYALYPTLPCLGMRLHV